MTRLFAAELLKLRTLRSTWGFGLVTLALRRARDCGKHRRVDGAGSARSRAAVPDRARRRVPCLDPRAARRDHPRDERVSSRHDRPDAARDAAPRSIRCRQAPHRRCRRRRADRPHARRGRRDGGHLARHPRRSPRARRGGGRVSGGRSSRRCWPGSSGRPIGGAVHSQVGALVGALVWMFVLEPICWVVLGLLDLEAVAEYLPAASLGGHGRLGGRRTCPGSRSVAVAFLGWITVATALAVLRTRRRDIT